MNNRLKKHTIVMGVNMSHDASICLLFDGEIYSFYESEKYNNKKHYSSLLQILEFARNDIEKILKKYDMDCNLIICASQLHMYDGKSIFNKEDLEYIFSRVFYPNQWLFSLRNFSQNQLRFLAKSVNDYVRIGHHFGHAATSFYNSGFDEAICVVMDGSGGYQKYVEGQRIEWARETESIYRMSYDSEPECLFKKAWYAHRPEDVQDDIKIEDVFPNEYVLVNRHENPMSVSYGQVFNAAAMYAINQEEAAGKVMGLAAYGKYNPSIEPPFKGKFANPQFSQHLKAHGESYPPEDICYITQKGSEFAALDFFDDLIEKYNPKNVCLSGGFYYNIIVNQLLVETFPDVNFYAEPMAGDVGISIGAAKYAHHSILNDKTKRPIKTLYYGKQATYERDLLENETEIKDVSPDDVAKLLEDQNMIAIFQGRTEAGPRALGNRSFLFDPRNPDGQDIVNTIKGREWYRPLAASVMEEHAKEWFNMGRHKNSPFMMYSFKCKESKKEIIPAVRHKDDSCRIQTVNRDQNLHYYELIEAFYKRTGVPMVLNTSFNMAGDMMVNDINRAFETCRKGKIPYLYLPEKRMLIRFD